MPIQILGDYIWKKKKKKILSHDSIELKFWIVLVLSKLEAASRLWLFDS